MATRSSLIVWSMGMVHRKRRTVRSRNENDMAEFMLVLVRCTVNAAIVAARGMRKCPKIRCVVVRDGLMVVSDMAERQMSLF